MVFAVNIIEKETKDRLPRSEAAGSQSLQGIPGPIRGEDISGHPIPGLCQMAMSTSYYSLSISIFQPFFIAGV
jgi:hypothetical protein